MALKALIVLVSCLLLSSCSDSVHTGADYQYAIPEGFPKPPEPADNPMSAEKVELGRWLFYDTALSVNQTTSCASCHDQQHAFAEPKVFSVGATGQPLKRNALALVNVGYNGSFTWAHNGLQSIEQQLLIPMFSENPIELGMTGAEQDIIYRLDDRHYQTMFDAAFGDSDINMQRINQALASFVRSLTSFDSAFDDYAYRYQDDALDGLAVAGMELFFSERLECFHCHGGFNFTQSSRHQLQQLDLKPFHNTGLYNIDGKGAYPLQDRGLIDITLEPDDMGKFRAPTLRNIAVTAPYMHDGSLATLEQVVDFYSAGGRAEGVNNPFKSEFVKGFVLSEEERQALLAFLQSLTDEKFLTNPQFSNPHQVVSQRYVDSAD
ncbi:MbnH family di-heme enzyme [Aestuariibacter salexigens]|uniref:MbnH family di-heme enzyme n=1 Tax=Aestuariibacter salexigens TaxID=226010 RepID=UPI000424E42C|nr:MbnH family di-heme enzyme [Aestuariibacter salexigens]